MISITLVLTEAGADTGPFDLYSDATSYTVPFQTGVSRATLQSGYGTTAPDGTTIVRVTSTSALCPVSIDITLQQQYTLNYSLYGGGAVPPEIVSNPSPYAIFQITINDVITPRIVDIGGAFPVALQEGAITFNSDDKIVIYTQSYADTGVGGGYTGSELSLDISNTSDYSSIIYSDGSGAAYEPKYFEYIKLPGELWNNNIWCKAQAAAFAV